VISAATRTVTVHPARALRGALTIPGDKSISHRALILAALAEGTTRIRGLGPGRDVRSTERAIMALGAEVIEEVAGDGVSPATHDESADELQELRGVTLRVSSPGAARLRMPEAPIDCENSGTTMRLLAGVLAGLGGPATLVGDASLSRRPMERVAKPLRLMGATVEGARNEAGAGRPPLCVRGPSGGLVGIHYDSPVASAQVKSCVLLAGLFAAGVTRVSEPARSRDHSERMLRLFGVDVIEDGLTVHLTGPTELSPATVFVPGDVSSAAFFLAAAAGCPGSRIVLRNVGVNPTRTGFLDALERMGARVIRGGQDLWGFEPLADLVLHAEGPLRATTIEGAEIPRLIDELPCLSVLATQAEGTTVIRDAAELRVKETDRLAETERLIRALGGEVEPLPDGLRIPGGQTLSGGTVDAAGDHRLAMAAAVGALFGQGPTTILGAEAASVSYPSFFEDLRSLGAVCEE
jgi:3-phosphoshikimate 1-carboxyvinyltransferase